MKQRGMTLLELLIAMTILVIILGMSGIKLKGLLQRAKVAAAKSTISGLELALSSIRTDTGLYPASLSDTKSAEAPTGFSSSSWYGPYAETLSLVDPWGNAYYYKPIDDVIFGPTAFGRTDDDDDDIDDDGDDDDVETGGPFDKTYTVSTIPGTGKLLIDNSSFPVSSATVWLNGVEVVSPNEFGQEVTSIEKSVTLLTSNTLRIRVTSNPGNYFILTLTNPAAGKAFILLSYGRDGAAGGVGFDADVIQGEF